MSKVLSLKLDETAYHQTEKIRKRLKLPRNTYIRKALDHFNALYTRKALAQDYQKASKRLATGHLAYLQETELLDDLPEKI
ncbi:MAG: hypothetical protein IH978_00085 [Nitrospinae bacterium]|jgi:hypothetical protein|nr:hypothetical protein [Nitrospinota bacterium]